jgi:cell division protease FtsH
VKKNPEIIKNLSKKYREEHKSRIADHHKKYREENKESLLEYSKKYFEELVKRLNTKNITIQNNNMLDQQNDYYNWINRKYHREDVNDNDNDNKNKNNTEITIYINKDGFFPGLGISIQNDFDPNDFDSNDNSQNDDDDDYDKYMKRIEASKPGSTKSTKSIKSKNFEIIQNYDINFTHVGGYENVKKELDQCVDILKNHKKYTSYNIRIPKGLVLEGPPGTGKTLLAKALAGESKCNFIAVSGSDFQEKYVGVGPTRVKELFKLAKENVPCIIFIDEIDALGRKRSSDGESASNERDSTLNSLLVELDGFKNTTGVFVVAATNRIDLLDNALLRPGRIDKKIFIGLPDNFTRKSILDIHINGKPYDNSIIVNDLVDITEGLSGAEIENLLNEAMLNALRYNNTQFSYTDFDLVLNKMMVGWQPNEHQFTSDIIDHIAIHEMGHAIVGILSKHHSKMSKVVINLSSPRSPGYTVFETSNSNIYVREALFEHLMILLAGRIAEEVFYDVSVTTGAINDFEEALKLAEKMVVYYGMGTNIIYPSSSEKYKELIDNDVIDLIENAYKCAETIILRCKDLIYETSEILKQDKLLKADKIIELVNQKYPGLL